MHFLCSSSEWFSQSALVPLRERRDHRHYALEFNLLRWTIRNRHFNFRIDGRQFDGLEPFFDLLTAALLETRQTLQPINVYGCFRRYLCTVITFTRHTNQITFGARRSTRWNRRRHGLFHNWCSLLERRESDTWTNGSCCLADCWLRCRRCNDYNLTIVIGGWPLIIVIIALVTLVDCPYQLHVDGSRSLISCTFRIAMSLFLVFVDGSENSFVFDLFGFEKAELNSFKSIIFWMAAWRMRRNEKLFYAIKFIFQVFCHNE